MEWLLPVGENEVVFMKISSFQPGETGNHGKIQNQNIPGTDML